MVVALGSVLGTIEEVVDDLRDEGVAVGVLGVTCFRPVAGRGGARGAGPREAGRRRGEGVRGRRRRHRRPEHPGRHARPPGGGVRRRGRPRRPAGHPGVAARAPRRRARGAGSTRSACTSSTSTSPWCSASSSGPGTAGGRARTPSTCCATSAPSRPARTSRGPTMAYQEIKLYQTGTFVAGNRLLDPEQRSVQARMGRSNSLTSGHRACQGCGEALGARYVLDAAMRATDGKHGRGELDRLPRGLLDAVPRVVVAAALAALALRQRAGRRRRRRGRAARPRAARTSGSSGRPATGAPSTSASGRSRACSSATTTCSSSATTTRAT